MFWPASHAFQWSHYRAVSHHYYKYGSRAIVNAADDLTLAIMEAQRQLLLCGDY